VEVVEVTVSLPPPPKFPAWREELSLTFPALRWKHGNEAHLAYVPALGLEVAAAKAEELEKLLPKEIKLALIRVKDSASLRRMVELQRVKKVAAERQTVAVELPPPKRRAVESEREGEKQKKTILDEVCTNLL